MTQDRQKRSRLVKLPQINWGRIVLSLVFLLGFMIRLVDLQDPPLDFHPVRQLRSALIARSIYYQLAPDISDDLRYQAADMAALEVYEPPILESIVGWTYRLLGSEYVWVARIYNALFWVIGGLAIFHLLKRYVSATASLVGLLVYFCLPFGVIASRSFQPEPWMVMWIILTAWALDRWGSSKRWLWVIIAGLFGAVAILVKVVAVFFVLPVCMFVFLQSIGLKNIFKSVQVWIIGFMMILPTLLFYLIFHHQQSSAFLSFWVGDLSWMVLTSEFYADWLAMIKSLTGLALFGFAVAGITLATRKARAWLAGGWAGYVIYGLVFPYQYVTHEYYHLPLVALIALSFPFIIEPILSSINKQPWIWRWAFVGIVAFSSFYGLYVSRSILVSQDYRSEPSGWEQVGKAIPINEPFIALTADYGMRLRYYGHRYGASWPSEADFNLKALSSDEAFQFQAQFDELTAGKKYFVITALSQYNAQPNLKEMLEENYPLLINTDDFMIYHLSN